MRRLTMQRLQCSSRVWGRGCSRLVSRAAYVHLPPQFTAKNYTGFVPVLPWNGCMRRILLPSAAPPGARKTPRSVLPRRRRAPESSMPRVAPSCARVFRTIRIVQTQARAYMAYAHARVDSFPSGACKYECPRSPRSHTSLPSFHSALQHMHPPCA